MCRETGVSIDNDRVLLLVDVGDVWIQVGRHDMRWKILDAEKVNEFDKQTCIQTRYFVRGIRHGPVEKT
jgi:hypothetical protein